jgi:hypothetical protein
MATPVAPRKSRKKIEGKELQPLPVVPQELVRIEKQVLPPCKAGHNRYAQKECTANECGGKPAEQRLPAENEEGAAGPVAQQRETYHHVGEMVKLDNGKKAHQENLVGDRQGRDQQYCKARWAVILRAVGNSVVHRRIKS